MLISKKPMIIGVVAIVTSVAVTAGMAFALLDAFANIQYGRVFPLNRSSPIGSSVVDSEHSTLIIYGDSRANLWDMRKLETAVGPVQNLARGGFTSSQLLLQLQSEPVTRSKWAVVQIGINDIHAIGALPRHRREILVNLRWNLSRIIETLVSRSEYVVVFTIAPPGRVPLERRIVWDSDCLSDIASVNDFIRKLAANDARVRLLDASELLGGESVYLDAQYTDPEFFLHLTPAAYAVLDNHLLKTIGDDAGRDFPSIMP